MAARIERAVSMKATSTCSNPDEVVADMVADGWNDDEIVKYFQLLNYLPGEIKLVIKKARQVP